MHKNTFPPGGVQSLLVGSGLAQEKLCPAFSSNHDIIISCMTGGKQIEGLWFPWFSARSEVGAWGLDLRNQEQVEAKGGGA